MLLGMANPIPAAAPPPRLRVGGGQGRDADDPALEVDQGPAGVARVDRGAGLDHVGQRDPVLLVHGAPEGADDPLGDAGLQPQRVADGQGHIPDLQLGGVGEAGRVQPTGVDVQHGQVVGGEAADQPAGYCLPSARVIWKSLAPWTT